MIYIGIDNGVSGSIAVLNEQGTVLEFIRTPTIKTLSYTKKKQWIRRIDFPKLKGFFDYLIRENEGKTENFKTLIERPMVNPGRFKATASALRCLEATLIVLEECSIPYQYIGSKEWQKVMLPKGIKGNAELKKAGIEIAKRLFPNQEMKPDGDAFLIAEYCRKQNV